MQILRRANLDRKEFIDLLKWNGIYGNENEFQNR